jgi:hypothetical protein
MAHPISNQLTPLHWLIIAVQFLCSLRPQEALNLLVTEECYWALLYMPLYTFLHNLLNVLIQIANKMGLQEKILLGWPCDSYSANAKQQLLFAEQLLKTVIV